MKKLFALLFSFQLIVSPVLAAEVAPTQAPGAEEDAYVTSGAGDKKKNGGYDFYVSQITAIATSALGTSIVTSCKTFWKVPSLALVMAGSIAHIASEFLGAKASNEDHKARLKDLKIKEAELKATGDSSQKAALEQRLVEEKATLKFLKNRATWMTAVSVIYTAAVTSAIIENIIHNIPAYGTIPNTFYLYFVGGCGQSSEGGGLISWGTLLSTAYGMGAGKLGGGAISQYGTMLITLLNLAVPTLSKTVLNLYDQPIPRIATFGVMLALVATVTSGLYVRVGIAKDNIKKLEKVIAQFKANSEGTPTAIATGETASDDEVEDKIKGKNNLKPMVETKKKECLSTANGKADFSEAACAKRLTLTKATIPAGFNLPTMNKINNLSTDMANALANGDEASAGNIAGEIGSYAARAQSELDATKKLYNDLQKKNNKPVMDFDKSVKEQMASIQGAINDAAKSQNMDLASLGSGSNKLDEESSKTSDAPVVTTAAPTTATEIPVDPLAGLGGTEEVTLPEVKTASAAQDLNDFESTEQDISKKPETSIFKQLSNRYILNYTKMFETKKSLEPAKAAPTN